MTPEYVAIHDSVMRDPETVWDRLYRFLCSDAPEVSESTSSKT